MQTCTRAPAAAGSIKDPINLVWNTRHTVARVAQIHGGTGRCDGRLSNDDICGTEQTYTRTTSCKHTHKKPCGSRDGNNRRYHARIYRSGTYNEVPSHQDQGCTLNLKEGARFNLGRDNQKARVSASGCQPGQWLYWGNTLSIAQGCGVGNQSSDGYVWYVR